ncbi:hypothetical protein D3C86_1461000 [compost metagenome]
MKQGHIYHRAFIHNQDIGLKCMLCMVFKMYAARYKSQQAMYGCGLQCGNCICYMLGNMGMLKGAFCFSQSLFQPYFRLTGRGTDTDLCIRLLEQK